MEETVEKILREIYKKNQIVWFAVLFGMVSLIGLSFIAYSFGFIEPVAVVDPAIADKITMFTILGLLIISFYIKRGALTLAKIIDKARNSKMAIDINTWPLKNGDTKMELLARAVQIASRNRLIIWFIADLIVIAALINFIMAPVVNSFLIYGIVAVYSLVINFPSYKFFKRIYLYIYENY